MRRLCSSQGLFMVACIAFFVVAVCLAVFVAPGHRPDMIRCAHDAPRSGVVECRQIQTRQCSWDGDRWLCTPWTDR